MKRSDDEEEIYRGAVPGGKECKVMRWAWMGLLLAVATISLAAEKDADKKKEPEQPPLPTPLPEPGVRFILGPRQGSSETDKHGLGSTPGGAIDVAQLRADTLVITMSGMAIAAGVPCSDSNAAIVFDVVQQFDVVASNPRVTQARLIAEAQLTGVLRCNRPGAGVAATDPPAHASLETGGVTLFDFGFEPRSLSGQKKVFVNDRVGPTPIVVPTGTCLLRAQFGVHSSHPGHRIHRNVAYTIFGASPSRRPEWLLLLDPTVEAYERDLGFRVLLRVEPTSR